LKNNFDDLKESCDSLSKINEFFKKEFSNTTTKFSNGSKTLKRILSIQIPYCNKSGLCFNKGSNVLINFPKFNERPRQRPLRLAYKNHFQKVFTKCVGQSDLKCCKYV